MKSLVFLCTITLFIVQYVMADAATYHYNLTIQTGWGVSGGDLYAGNTKVITGCSSTCSGTGTTGETSLILKYKVPDPWYYGQTIAKELTISTSMDKSKTTKNIDCMIGMQTGWPLWLWLKSFTEN